MGKLFVKNLLFGKSCKQLFKRAYAANAPNIVNQSVGQASINKGIADWDADIRPVYMDAQVCNLLMFKFIVDLMCKCKLVR